MRKRCIAIVLMMALLLSACSSSEGQAEKNEIGNENVVESTTNTEPRI